MTGMGNTVMVTRPGGCDCRAEENQRTAEMLRAGLPEVERIHQKHWSVPSGFSCASSLKTAARVMIGRRAHNERYAACFGS
jgi:hypothetical protein